MTNFNSNIPPPSYLKHPNHLWTLNSTLEMQGNRVFSSGDPNNPIIHDGVTHSQFVSNAYTSQNNANATPSMISTLPFNLTFQGSRNDVVTVERFLNRVERMAMRSNISQNRLVDELSVLLKETR